MNFSLQDKPKLIIWLGPMFFLSHLRDMGWEVCWSRHQPGKAREWDDILELSDGRIPDMVIVADTSLPPHVLGMESFPCPTVFYAVDSHIHSWYPHYAQGFDFVLVSLKDHLPLFTQGRHSEETVWWSPPYAKDAHQPPEPGNRPEVEFPLLFVGTVDQQITPERFKFMEELRTLLPELHITKGFFPEIYPKGEIILNECSAGDLNFRVFEALGCGKCLLTPKIGHGLLELFIDGGDLFTYPAGDAKAAAEVAHMLLKKPELCEKAAANGLAKVNALHRSSHRAEAFVRHLENLGEENIRQRVQRRLDEASVISKDFLRLLYLHHAENIGVPSLQKAYLKAAGK